MRRKAQGFLRHRTHVLALDALARRYGVLPTDLFALSLEDYNLNLLIFNEGVSAENQAIKKQNEAAKRR